MDREDPKIVLALPSLGTVPKEYIGDLMKLAYSRILHGWQSVESSILPIVRNTCLEGIYANEPDFTHVLFIDADMSGFDEESVKRLWFFDKDIIAATYVKRMPPFYFVGEPINNDQFMIALKKNQICPMKAVATGFMLIKREVLDATREETQRGPVWFTMDREPRIEFEEETEEFIEDKCKNLDYDGAKDVLRDAIAFGQTSHIGTPMGSEDICFCRKATKLGFEVWQDCGLLLNHHHSNAPIPASCGVIEE